MTRLSPLPSPLTLSLAAALGLLASYPVHQILELLR